MCKATAAESSSVHQIPRGVLGFGARAMSAFRMDRSRILLPWLLVVHILRKGETLAWLSPPVTRRRATLRMASPAPPPPRDAPRRTFLGRTAGLAGGLLTRVSVADAKPPTYLEQRGSADAGLQGCPGQPVKKSCWSTEDSQGRRIPRWQPPVSLKGQAAIVADIEGAMGAYPQEGQGGVDGGGWALAEKNVGGANGAVYLRYLFTSKKFKYLDDLEFVVDARGMVSVRSASQNAGFDYNVNATRVNYIAKSLEKRGWKVKLV